MFLFSYLFDKSNLITQLALLLCVMPDTGQHYGISVILNCIHEFSELINYMFTPGVLNFLNMSV